jgi:translation initiation factor 4A
VEVGNPKTQVLILSPTRELATQTAAVAHELGRHMPVTTYAAVGGTPVAQDERALRGGRAQVLVGTPGRVYDLIANRRALDPATVRVLIVDEADQMLDDKFLDQFRLILQLGFTCQIAFFSATMSPTVVQTASEMMGGAKPTELLIPKEEVTLEGIKQFYVLVEREAWKLDTLCDLYEHLVITQALIYCNKRTTAEWLAEQMTARGFELQCIHGDLDAAERTSRMRKFRDGSVRVLISTDLTARGIDVQQVSLVINFEMPMDAPNYIHRIGRSGRYGRKGAAINLVTPDEKAKIDDIQTYYRTVVNELPADLAALS